MLLAFGVYPPYTKEHIVCKKFVLFQVTYVVVHFFFQLIFILPLFLGMAMYANELKTKEKQKLTTTYTLISHC